MKLLLESYPALRCAQNDIEKALSLLIDMYKRGGKLLCCGNGGSASDCEHIVGELMKSFRLKRPVTPELKEKLSVYGEDGVKLADTLEMGLPALSLCGHSALSTAYGNDRDPYMVFAQQLNGFGCAGDTLLALTTSGNSRNCLLAAYAAKAKEMKVIAITGQGGGRMSEIADVCIALPEKETYLVQELTLPVYHFLCAKLEERFFS